VYLNISQFGHGVYGVEAASLKFYRKHASRLTRPEAATLAAVLPNPIRLHADRPSAYVASRRDWILGQMRGPGRQPISGRSSAVNSIGKKSPGERLLRTTPRCRPQKGRGFCGLGYRTRN